MRPKEKRTHKTTKKPPKDAYDLPNLPTRVLLRYLRSSYLPYYYLDDEDPSKDEKIYGFKPFRDGPVISWESIKNELATREHVMNKAEGEAYRRMMATQHHGPKKRTRVV